MELRDSIPLKALVNKESLIVPTQLSKETAFRLVRRGLAAWLSNDKAKRRGVIVATETGLAALIKEGN